MDLDLDHVLKATRKGQWSVHELDWDVPLQGTGQLSETELRETALMIVFTAGLEYQAAEIFRLCARFVSEGRARQIYELFAIDERRHAQAELLMARRYGVTWRDLPLPARLLFRLMQEQFRHPSRLLHEFTSTQIILFEIALDALLIPALKEIDDPLQREVFRRIDVDESRHLAMDYWLLERKGQGIDYERQRLTRRDWMEFAALMPMALLGFATTARRAQSMQRRIRTPERMKNYWNRVGQVPKRAPHALNLRAYRDGVEMQRRLQRLMGWVSGTDERPRGAAAA